MMRIESSTTRKDGRPDRRYAHTAKEFIVSEAGEDIAQVASASARGAVQRLAAHTGANMADAMKRWEAREV